MKIVKESPDTLCSNGLYMGPTTCLQGKKIGGYNDSDAYAFGLDVQYGQMKVSKAGESHASMDKDYETKLGWEDEYDNLYEGRLWTKHKIITFWKYPPVDEFEKIIKSIESELKTNEGLNIDMWNDPSWKVEVILSPIDGKPSWDSNFTSIVPMQYSTVLIPLKQYGGSLETKRVKHEDTPLSPSKLGRTVPKGYGSNHPKAESRAKWRMAKPFESFVSRSLDEAMDFERNKDPLDALGIGIKSVKDLGPLDKRPVHFFQKNGEISMSRGYLMWKLLKFIETKNLKGEPVGYTDCVKYYYHQFKGETWRRSFGMGQRMNLNEYINKDENHKYTLNNSGKRYLEKYKFFDDKRESIKEELEFERGKDPKSTLNIGRKGYMCGQCGSPTTETGENISYGSEVYKETLRLFKDSPEKIIPTYCADCYFNDQAAQKEADREWDREEEMQRWEEENGPYGHGLL